MRVTSLGCLHGYFPKTPGGDLLIITGDLTSHDTEEEYDAFDNWLFEQRYECKVVIAGNHDNYLQKTPNIDRWFSKTPHVEYLCDSGTEFQGWKIWGTPWCSKFPGMNPRTMAFCKQMDVDLACKFNMIPDGTDIVITHCPPLGVLDSNYYFQRCGSHALRMAIEAVKPQLHVFSHIHEEGNKTMMLKHAGPNTLCVNCSVNDEYYYPRDIKNLSFEI